MCGIAGFQGNFDDGLLARMSEAVAHRGPDGSGSFFCQEYGVGLTHRRLAIIDLSHAADQPMCDEAAGLAIVFNGEIYNYRELRTELLHDGYAFRTQSDTEVLLRLYARDGLGVKPHVTERLLRYAQGVCANQTYNLLYAHIWIIISP